MRTAERLVQPTGHSGRGSDGWCRPGPERRLWPMRLTRLMRLMVALAAMNGWMLGGSVLGGLAFCQPALAVQVTDDLGHTLQWASAPQRIVSLLPSLTETVCALGQCQRLVGVDRFSNYPARVRALPQLGGGMDPSMEGVLALRPDVVLLSPASPALERLRALGVPVLALEPKTYADVQRVTATLAVLLEQSDSGRLWREVDAALTRIARKLPAHARQARVYFEVNSAPYAAGASSFIGETLQRLGVRNIVPPELGPFPLINPEFVVRADPDVVMLGNADGDANRDALARRPGWRTMRALRAGRVCEFDADQTDTLVRPGPRLALGAQAMADCLARTLP